jgi:Cu(I)/Ag(I) efflux system protein CusF
MAMPSTSTDRDRRASRRQRPLRDQLRSTQVSGSIAVDWLECQRDGFRVEPPQQEFTMNFRSIISGLSFAAGAVFFSVAQAQTAAPSASGAMQMGAGAMTDGEVRKVDKENKKITLKHGEIKNLDMPGMTMVFQVKDPALLDRVKQGDKVMFKAEKANGALVVTEIHPAK